MLYEPDGQPGCDRLTGVAAPTAQAVVVTSAPRSRTFSTLALVLGDAFAWTPGIGETSAHEL